MSAEHNTATPLSGEIIAIRFSANMPQHDVPYVRAEARTSEEVAALQQELGDSALQLQKQNEELACLQAEVDQLKMAIEQAGEVATAAEAKLEEHKAQAAELAVSQSPTSVKSTHPPFNLKIPVVLLDELKVKLPVKENPADVVDIEKLRQAARLAADAEAQEEAFVPDPALSPRAQLYERLILSMLKQPDFKYVGKNAMIVLRDDLEITDYRVAFNLRYDAAKRFGFLKTVIDPKSGGKRSTEYELLLDKVEVCKGKAFMTERVLEALEAAKNQKIELTDAAVQQESTETSAETKDDEADTAAAEPAAAGLSSETPEASSSSSTRPNALPISARTGRALEASPDAIPGYRSVPDTKPFLAHSREKPGIKRRR